ncbi:MAG: alpha/beta hydrolase [Myxococcales bacterium]|nr:alpha/beta hydrolase [Myxococcales bacterium]
MRFAIDGHEIDYEIRGEGRTVVLLHGLTTDRRILVEACEPVLSAEPGWRRIYLDLPGHGASRGNKDRAFADALVDALDALIQEVQGSDEKPPLVLGYAYGAYLAQGLARARDLGGLCLICPVVEADFGKRQTPPRRVVTREEGLPFSDDERERAAFDEVAVQQTRASLTLFQRVVHPANIAVDPIVVAAVRDFYALARPYMQALQAFERPVAIACGRHDHWVGFEDALRIARACPGSSYAVVPDCGHLLPLEAPGPFRAVLADWLLRVRSAAGE